MGLLYRTQGVFTVIPLLKPSHNVGVYKQSFLYFHSNLRLSEDPCRRLMVISEGVGLSPMFDISEFNAHLVLLGSVPLDIMPLTE